MRSYVGSLRTGARSGSSWTAVKGSGGSPRGTFAGVDRRRVQRRRRLSDEPYLKLGWTVVDTEELVS
jgi:hypothetical protein